MLTRLYTEDQIREALLGVLEESGVEGLSILYLNGVEISWEYLLGLEEFLFELEDILEDVVDRASELGTDDLSVLAADVVVQELVREAEDAFEGMFTETVEDEFQFGPYGFIDHLVDSLNMDLAFFMKEGEGLSLPVASTDPQAYADLIHTLPDLYDFLHGVIRRSERVVKHVFLNILQNEYYSESDLYEDLDEAQKFVDIFAVPFTNSSTLSIVLELLREYPEFVLVSGPSEETSESLSEESRLIAPLQKHLSSPKFDSLTPAQWDKIAQSLKSLKVTMNVFTGGLPAVIDAMLTQDLSFPCSMGRFEEVVEDYGLRYEPYRVANQLIKEGLIRVSEYSLFDVRRMGVLFSDKEAKELEDAPDTTVVKVVYPTAKLKRVFELFR